MWRLTIGLFSIHNTGNIGNYTTKKCANMVKVQRKKSDCWQKIIQDFCL